jgi:hypothetical protein
MELNLPQCTRGSDGMPKKSFVTKDAAARFAADFYSKNQNTVLQSAYACEDCKYWHLSSTDAESHALVQVDYEKAGLLASPPGLGHKYAHHQSEIKKLYTSGMNIADIGRKFNIPYPYVYEFLVEIGLHTKNPQRVEAAQTGRRNPATIESIDAQQAMLMEQMKELEAKKKMLIEAKALKIYPTNDNNGVIIRKEGASLALSFDDAYELINKVKDYLDQITAGTEAA